jgi:hypothetical protein
VIRPGGAVTEQQQLVQTRQVVLMPQQVLVPFVQTTVSGPVRVAETQETSVINVASTTTTGATVLGTGQAAVLPGTAGAASTPTNLNDCLAQLRAYEQRITQLVAQTEALATQVELLKGGLPAPRPK